MTRTGVHEPPTRKRVEAFGGRSPYVTGSSFLGTFDDIAFDEITAALADCRFNRVETVEETGSTNADVIERARADEAEGLVLLAGSQTAGRGRLGRSWLGNPGGSILCSVLVRPDLEPSSAPLLTIAAGMAAVDALGSATGLSAELKWPNDLMAGDRKLGGILTESVITGDTLEFCVVGIGLNINWPAGEIPAEIAGIATSVSAEQGTEAGRGPTLQAFLAGFSRYAGLAESDPAALLAEYRHKCSTIGRRVSIDAGGKTIEGIAEGVDSHGRLLVETEDGETVAIDAGDLTEFREA